MATKTRVKRELYFVRIRNLLMFIGEVDGKQIEFKMLNNEFKGKHQRKYVKITPI
jgi:hypothetical protein